MTESISGDELLQRAVNLHQQGCFDEAENIYNQILSKNPDHSDVLHYIGVIALQRNDFNRTITFISNALRVNKMMPWAFLNLGTSYRGLKQFDKALKSYECALKIDPLFSSAISNIGVLFYEQKNYQKSLEYFNHALSLDSSLADAYYNRTNIFLFYERFNEALHDYSQAIRLNLNNLDAYLNRGQSYKRLKKYDEAIDDFSYIIKLNPLCAEAYFHRAVTKIYRKNDDETVLHDLIKSAEINPNLRYLLGTIFFRKKQLCDWDGLEELGQQCLDLAKNGVHTITPFGYTSHYDSLLELRKITEVWVSSDLDAVENQYHTYYPPKNKRKKITLGFFSADFNDHPVTYCSAGMFRSLDKNKFNVVGFYWGKKKDIFLQKMAGYFDKFYDVSLASDLDIINLARKEELDIAIDMNGCTAESHPNVFLNQVAPIQVNYLGYPGTMGTSQMDYIIADPVVIPATSQKFYSEKIAYLKCLMPHDNELELSNKNYSKTDLDLPEKAFIYCAFNNSYKINSRIWKNWMTILTRVPNSVLWLSYNSLISSKNLKKAAEAYGVDPKRLIFAHRWPDVREHFSRLSVANLFLDTYPYNAHTTASAALWAGVPVLTMQGETFASRVASSLLITSQLPELIVTTDEDYVNLAVDLALDLQKLANIKMRLSTFRLNNPLFQTKWYTKEIENLFIQMYERKWNQQAPDNIESTQ